MLFYLSACVTLSLFYLLLKILFYLLACATLFVYDYSACPINCVCLCVHASVHVSIRCHSTVYGWRARPEAVSAPGCFVPFFSWLGVVPSVVLRRLHSAHPSVHASICPFVYQVSFDSLRVTCSTRSGFYPMFFFVLFFVGLGWRRLLSSSRLVPLFMLWKFCCK